MLVVVLVWGVCAAMHRHFMHVHESAIDALFGASWVIIIADITLLSNQCYRRFRAWRCSCKRDV